MTVTVKIELTLETIVVSYTDVYKIAYNADYDQVVLWLGEEDDDYIIYAAKHLDIEIS